MEPETLDMRKNKRRMRKNRETKFCLVFDEKNRTEFLTGFRKRKEERRKKGHEQMIAKHKEEKRLAKQKRLEQMRNRREFERGVPEVEHILDQEIDMGDHTVTVAEVEPLRLDVNGLGQNHVERRDETDDASHQKPSRAQKITVSQPKTTKSKRGGQSNKKRKNSAKGRHKSDKGRNKSKDPKGHRGARQKSKDRGNHKR